MYRIYLSTILFLLLTSTVAMAQQQFESDVIKTAAGDLTITFIGHGSLKFAFAGKNFYVDPYSKVADYARLPKADVIFITHEHPDHLDAAAIEKVRAGRTKFVVSAGASRFIEGAIVMNNEDIQIVEGVTIEAVPAYNIEHKRDNGQPFHPRGAGNGYVFTFGDKRLYVAGDTENIPEMKQLGKIDIAFLPMNLPYTMTPEMTADAARMIQPAILYPYHFGETNPAKLARLLKDRNDIDIRIRKMQ